MVIKRHLTGTTRKQVSACLQQAYRRGQVRVIRRIQVLLQLAAGQTVAEVATFLQVGEQTVRDYLAAFLHTGVASLASGRSSGRPAKLTQSQRQELAAVITAGPLAAGYASGCWSAVLIGDWITRHFGVT